MGAILGGTMRSPFTGVVFALELTHDVNMLLPLLVAVTIAHGFTVLVLGRSILTEKVARRGFHLSREYAVDPLEILFVREVMRPTSWRCPPERRFDDAGRVAARRSARRDRSACIPIVDAALRLLGVVTRVDLQQHVERPRRRRADAARDHRAATPVVAYPDEPLRVIVHRMAETGLTRFPVVERGGDVACRRDGALDDLLKARARNLDAEQRRERVLASACCFRSRFAGAQRGAARHVVDGGR